jgi:hypothetical protein
LSTVLTAPDESLQPRSGATGTTGPQGLPPSFSGIYRRVSRRETHSPRSLVAIVLAVVLILVLAWIGTEIVLALLGAPALLVAPVDMFTVRLTTADIQDEERVN